MAIETLRVRVARIIRRADDINTYELVDPDGRPLPPFSAGAHVDVHVDGEVTTGRIRQFSLCNEPHETHRYLIAVLRESHGRGGSVTFHDNVHEGDIIAISPPRNNFPLDESAARHLLIAGGIGITPILAMIGRLAEIGADYRLYYCTRTPEQTAFHDILSRPEYAGRVEFIFDNGDPSQGLDVKSLLAARESGTHLYCCGPGGLMSAVKDAAAPAYPPDAIHFEYFSADPAALTGEVGAFQVKIQSTEEVIDIPTDRTILEVLRERGWDLDSSCEDGVCGTCATAVIEGLPEHRDFFLTEKSKKENKWILICCSRSKTPILTLGL